MIWYQDKHISQKVTMNAVKAITMLMMREANNAMIVVFLWCVADDSNHDDETQTIRSMGRNEEEKEIRMTLKQTVDLPQEKRKPRTLEEKDV